MHIWILEIEYYQVHTQFRPQGAEKQLIKANVGGGGMQPNTNTGIAEID